MLERPLTHKQQSFVVEYMIDKNATQAAIRAGYSAKTANRIGPELLTKRAVAEAVAAELEKRLHGMPDDISVLPVRVDGAHLVLALIKAGQLLPKDATVKKAVTFAVERLIAVWVSDQLSDEQYDQMVASLESEG